MPPKKLRLVSLGVLLGALLVTSRMTAQVGINPWTSTNGPDGGWIAALAIDPGTPATLYAATAGGGIFKSINGGESWNAINTGLPYANYPGLWSLAMDPQTPFTLYLGTNQAGIFKSTNGGGNWSAVNTGLPNYPQVRALVIDPQAPATLYAAVAGNPDTLAYT